MAMVVTVAVLVRVVDKNVTNPRRDVRVTPGRGFVLSLEPLETTGRVMR
jgi:hypothetical protein